MLNPYDAAQPARAGEWPRTWARHPAIRRAVAAGVLAALSAFAVAQAPAADGTGPAAAPAASAASAASAAPAASAAAAPAPVPPIPYPSVAAALSALEARDGNGTVVTHSDDGWVIINEPLAAAQWSFAPKTDPAYPAVVRRVIQRGPDRRATVDTARLCEGPAAACEALMTQFTALNDRITQAARARDRNASTQPTP